ncbi:cytochrome oxidase complex assembly protein 1-domain-containing protein [Apiosordaria backusii]|uniref:Cytochrome oxidase complex assembly protein 1-domain-containing protein n=1 Tax=Apiosordaria backusii TaxID=314023 RepID=A0AA40EXU1_9PEZI|nr:cytochrome oxidase complex assembly protein 1-domain-containing protein [Apiosordaria backusii]
MLSRLTQRGVTQSPLFRRISSQISQRTQPLRQQIQKRTLIPAPKRGDGPLMERRADRELPPLPSSRWMKTLPLFALCVAAASVAIFNYQKFSSPVVGATLYALRTSDVGREHLGDNIYFAQQIPWISGTLNQVQGRIDITFRVKGTKGEGVMRFASFRPSPRGVFETTEWSLEMDGGKKIDLLDGAEDPFKVMTGADQLGIDLDDDEEDSFAAKRGFRK